MDDWETLKSIGILTVNFLFSFSISNFLAPEIDLIKTPVTSLKIFCSAYCLGHVVLTFTTTNGFTTLSSQGQEQKGMSIISSVFKWCVGIIIFHCLAVLYGASLSQYVEETFMWSMMMSNLAIIPCLLVGTDEVIKIVVSKRRCISLASCMCIVVALTLMGAWFGAFALPLDWDRDWQVWPIPCAAGAMIGHALSLLTSGTLAYWKFRNKDKNKFI